MKSSELVALAKTLDPAECWPWHMSTTEQGYGQINLDGRIRKVHRAAFVLLVGDPGPVSLDHRCHTDDKTCPGGPACPHRRCWNPAHLRPGTQAANVLGGRGFAPVNKAKTRCPAGHAYTPENTLSEGPGGRWRKCRTCHNERQRARYAARKATP